VRKRPAHASGRTGPAPRAAPDEAALSGSEIEALCAKAARGAGMAWGLAEEAGFAAAWLAARGVDGPRALADHLAWAEGRPWQEICPTVSPGAWKAPGGGVLCPVALGATLCDFCTLPDAALDEDDGLGVGPVSRPVMLLPFLAAMAERLGHAITLSWPGGRLVVATSGGMAGALPALAGLARAPLTLSRSADPAGAEPVAPRQDVSRDTIDRLDALALKTTVPPSASSRADAGAGGSDND